MFKQFHSRHPVFAWAGEDAHPFFMSERHGHKRPGHKGAPGGGWGDQAHLCVPVTSNSCCWGCLPSVLNMVTN
jgi:hypothetical protein